MTHLQNLIDLALQEDIPQGDITTDSIGINKKGTAKLMAKEDLILSGCEVFEQVFKTLDLAINFSWNFSNGSKIKKGKMICTIEGNLPSLLKAERTALNFLGHLSGVATLTAQYVQAIKKTKTKITDTRKTTPGMRTLEKAAVTHGGGVNHRMSLSDMVLIKENHIRMAGSITRAIEQCRNKNAKIEVETTNIKEVKEALEARVDRIMLDNMSVTEMKKAVKLVKNQCVIEASGNMNLKTILPTAKTGVDFISVGKITHSAPTADLSLLFEA